MFCLRLLKSSFPENISIHVSEKGHDIVPTISDISSKITIEYYDALFLAFQPDFIITPDSLLFMLDVFEKYNNIDCLLPVKSSISSSLTIDPYYTLRGFEKVTTAIRGTSQSVDDAHDLSSSFFLIRTKALASLPLNMPLTEILSAIPKPRVKHTLHALIHSFTKYYSERRSDIVELLPENIHTLLDIGCAKGFWGAEIKNKMKCRVVGVEKNPYAAEEAKKHLDEVIVGDFMSTNISGVFDCITCLDIIEHVKNISAFLDKTKKLLNDNGYLLLSIPNIGHWSIIEDLIAGRWDYVPAGHLCITHLRFFTKSTAEFFLKDSGFRIVSFKEESSSLPAYLAHVLNIGKQSGMEINEKSLSSLCYYITAQKIPGS